MSVSWGGQKEKIGLWTLRRSLLKQLIRLENGRLHLCVICYCGLIVLHYWVWKTIKQGHLSLAGSLFAFSLFEVNSWYISAFTHSFYIWVWRAPGSAPTFLVLADKCGRAWRITSSTPQHCRPLFKPTFFSVEEIRLCKVFLPDLAILIHRRGSIEVSRNPRSNFTFLWRPALTHIHVWDHNKVVCCCVFQKNFSKNVF